LAYGGPAVSVVSLASALSAEGVDVGVWCPDGSAADIVFKGVPSPCGLSGPLAQAVTSFGTPDLVHDNGIWLPHNHAVAEFCRRSSVPRILSPRGMLAPWARHHKRIKKFLAWHLYQSRDLRTATAFHATSNEEAADVDALSLGCPTTVIANGLDLAVYGPDPAKATGEFRQALFLGRIYPVKGLPNLMQAWARVRPAGWQLSIVGPDEAGHKAHLEGLARDLSLGDVVNFEGPVSGEFKVARLRRANLFILPSLSESFGMAVAEAFAAGLPVITTTAAPWSSIVENQLGWWVPPTVDGLAMAIASATSLSDEVLRAMGRRGAAFVGDQFSWSSLCSRYLDLYRSALVPV